MAVEYADIGAVGEVDTVIVPVSAVVNVKMLEEHVAAEVEGESPACAVAQGEACNLHPVALGEEEELRPHDLAGPAEPLAIVGVFLYARLDQRVDRQGQLLPLAVYHAFARQFDGFRALGQDESILRVVFAHHITVAHYLELIVVVGIGTAEQDGTTLQMELHTTLELDSSSEVSALAERDTAASLLGELVDRLL